jgi:hypothetical protein
LIGGKNREDLSIGDGKKIFPSLSPIFESGKKIFKAQKIREKVRGLVFILDIPNSNLDPPFDPRLVHS